VIVFGRNPVRHRLLLSIGSDAGVDGDVPEHGDRCHQVSAMPICRSDGKLTTYVSLHPPNENANRFGMVPVSAKPKPP
jgi:hypothetical protein